MGWRDVRMNKVAQHVSMRQELEFQERLGSGKERYEQLAREANRFAMAFPGERCHNGVHTQCGKLTKEKQLFVSFECRV